jgi:hypothetical protein
MDDAGWLADSERSLEKALAEGLCRAPDHPAPLNNLGVFASQDAGQPAGGGGDEPRARTPAEARLGSHPGQGCQQNVKFPDLLPWFLLFKDVD